MPSILIVDDEPAIRESVAYALRRDGFETLEAATLADAGERWPAADLVILDLMLPDGSGTELLKSIRQQSRVAVVILTSRDEETERVVGLELGADDYVSKPFSPRELVARVRAVLRRTDVPGRQAPTVDSTVRGPGGLSLSSHTRRAYVGADELRLSRTEFELLAVFLDSPDRVFTRDQLLRRVWGPDCTVTDRTVDVHIKTLRKKIDAAGGVPGIIGTVRGVGYRLCDPESKRFDRQVDRGR